MTPLTWALLPLALLGAWTVLTTIADALWARQRRRGAK